MKRKILFIISNLQTGGVSKSMTSLMNVIDRDRYDVSLMIVSPTGPLMELLPKDLRIITNPIWSNLTDRFSGAWRLLKGGHPILALGHCVRLFLSVIGYKALAGRMIARMMPGLTEEFDTIVDFNGQQQLYYMVNKLRGKKKVTFFHNDYEKWPYYYSADKIYYAHVKFIFTVSPQCALSLKKFFPQQSKKIGVIENISSLSLINKLAESSISEEICTDSSIPTILTLGHLCERKGTHWAIQAAILLMQRGINFKWFFLGDSEDFDKYAQMVHYNNLSDHIIFLGVKTNPYPYIRLADLIVHPAKFEGRSIALDEAKLLCKPVVVTNFSTVNDQFENGYNATICRMNPESIADAIEELLQDDELRNRYIKNLTSETYDNSSEIEKLYKIFDD